MAKEKSLPRKLKIPRVEEHDAVGTSGKGLKRQKNKAERKRARQNPECQPNYGRYYGWET